MCIACVRVRVLQRNTPISICIHLSVCISGWDYGTQCGNLGLACVCTNGYSCTCGIPPPSCTIGNVLCTLTPRERQECVSPGTWTATTSCSIGKCCSGGACVRGGDPCGFGETCNSVSSQCESGSLCTDLCTPGDKKCDGNKVQECQDGCPGTPADFVQITDCGTGNCCSDDVFQGLAQVNTCV
jgi:hypothetical protein